MFRASNCVGRRLFSRVVAHRFLPFEEAREWARKSNIKNAREWRKLASGGRPLYIPSNPEKTYREEYIDLYDWLGQPPPPSRCRDGAVFDQIRNAEPRDERCFRQRQHSDGISKLLEMAGSFAAHFDFFRMPKHASVDLLFRRCDDDSPAHWAGLHVRTSRYQKPWTDNRIVFSHTGPAITSGCASVCFDDVHNVMHVIPAGYVAAAGIAISPTDGARGKYDSFRTEPEDLSASLNQIFLTGPLQSVDDWVDSSSRSRRDGLVYSSVMRLRSFLYPACGLRLTFPDSSVSIHNAELDGGLRILHRVAYWWKGRDHFECKLAKRIGLSHAVPLSVDDGIDLVVVIVNDDGNCRLRGCFVFPVHVLVAKGYLQDQDNYGLTKMIVYLDSDSDRGLLAEAGPRARKKHAWKQEFYIDLSSGEDSLSQNYQKFKNIVESLPKRSDEVTPQPISDCCPPPRSQLEVQSQLQHWLPFEAAREWARQSGIANQKEWRSCTFRPPNVPSNPDIVYRGLYKSLLDWLGIPCSREARTATAKKNAATPREVWCTRFVQQQRAIETFLRLAGTYAPDFHFEAAPKQSSVDLLFRPKTDSQPPSSDGSESYGALHIRSTTHKDKRCSRMVFRRMTCSRTTGCAVVAWDIVNNNFYVFPAGSVPASAVYVSICGTRGKYDRRRLEHPDDLSSVLAQVYETSPTRTKQQWGVTCLRLPRDIVQAGTVDRLRSLLYDPCGVGFLYPYGGATIHNAELGGGIKVLHRMAYRRRYKLMDIRYECTVTKLLGRTQVPFDVSDDIDLVALGIVDDTQALCGCYFFPKEVLRTQSILSVGHEGGRTSLSLYPPFASPSARISSGRKRIILAMQKWQEEFYIDLADHEMLAENRKRFQAILERVRAPKN